MLENCNSAQERWGGVHEIIDHWLKDRQALLVQYRDLGIALDEQTPAECDEQIQYLCQLLVDYVSGGHFSVYDQLMKEGEEFGDKKGLEIGKSLYAKIDQTTDFFLDFNDKYQDTDELEDIVRDLSTLGEFLANRFEPEDQMIEILHNAHANQIA